MTEATEHYMETMGEAVADGRCASDQGIDSAALVARIQGGDTRAENALILHFRPGLELMLEYRVRNLDLARQLAHESLMLVLEKLRIAGIEDASQLTGFIHRVALNLLQRGHRADAAMVAESAAPAYGAQLEPETSQFETQRARLIDCARRLMRSFRGGRDRELLLAWYVTGDSRSAICARLGVSEAHFERVIYRARTRFKDALGKA